LEFLFLNNVRTDTVLKASWEEFDLDQAVWTVPLANHMRAYIQPYVVA
jgi:hypothetical protein